MTRNRVKGGDAMLANVRESLEARIQTAHLQGILHVSEGFQTSHNRRLARKLFTDREISCIEAAASVLRETEQKK